MLRRRRKLLIAVIVLLIGAAIGVAIWLRKHAPPDAVRLLPEVEDGVLYLNLKPLRMAGVLKKTTTPREPEYEQFVRETGFEFERDLDQAAFAVHGPGAAGGQTRYSEILVGRFDGSRAEAYFKKLAQGVENYRETTIYSIPHEGRTVRVAILGLDQVAVSNLENPAAIHEIIDHYRSSAVPRGGPALVREHYHDVLFGSLAWFIGNVGSSGLGQLPSKGLDIPMIGGLVGGSTVVASVRYTGSARLKMEAFAASEQQAKNIAANLQILLAMFTGAESSVKPSGSDPDVKAFFDSIQVAQHDDRVILTATLPPGFVKKVLTEPPTEQMTAPVPAPAPPPAPKKKRRK
ncbi:MAG: DUF3352 domain-containing protein [Acidobacteriia bacterium]|nr:DUF3352 domain-containing protein [Terriglobia bacterium]